MTLDAPQRHLLFNNKEFSIPRMFNRGALFMFGKEKVRYFKSYTKNFRPNVVVRKGTQTLSKINSGKLMNLARTKIGKGGLVVAAGLVGWNLLQHAFKSVNPQPAIPRNYDRGYDVLKETLTDFGSPVKLAKAANKTITPYKSAVRKGTYTTSRSVRNSNVSLALHDRAIKHHEY